MVIRNSAKYIAAALLAVACTVKETAFEQAPTTSEPVSSVVPVTVNIQFTDQLTALIEDDLKGGVETKSAELNTALEELGITQLERVFPDAGIYEARTRKLGLHHFYKAVLQEGTSVTKATVSLADVPGVVSVTPSRPIQKRAFNDPYLSKQWHYVNKTYSGADINVQGVWDRYTKGDSKVVVCVVDEPVDASHEDLKDNIWKDASGHTGYNYARKSYDLSIRPANGNGDIGHGTHVAGTVAAVNNNGKGVAGIAGGDSANGVNGVRIMSHAIFSGTSSADDTQTCNAIKDAADRGALISQNSWGYSADGALDGKPDGKITQAELNEYKSWDYDPVMQAAIQYFVTYAGCDAQGNQKEGSPMKGGLVFFAAGNENIDYDYVGSNDPNAIAVGSYGYKGTKASYSNYGSWVDIAAPGGGYTSEADVVWSTLPKSIKTSGYAGDDWVGTSMACPHVSGVAALIVSYFGGPGFTADDARKILFGGLGQVIGGNSPIGKKMDALASFEWALRNGYTGGGGSSTENTPPVLKLDKTEVTVKAHESVTVNFEAYDPEGYAVTIDCEPGSEALTLDKNAKALRISGWKATPGTYTARIVVSDGTYTATETLTYTLLPNHAPVVKKQIQDVLMSGVQKVTSISLDDVFTDEDGETLSIYADRGDAVCVTATVKDSQIKIVPITFGVATITVTATDFMGEDASLVFRVAVTDPKHPVRVTPEVASTEALISIETETKVPVKLSLYASTGGLVDRLETEASAFDPISLDVSALAPGRYTAVLEYEGSTRQVRVLKY